MIRIDDFPRLEISLGLSIRLFERWKLIHAFDPRV